MVRRGHSVMWKNSEECIYDFDWIIIIQYAMTSSALLLSSGITYDMHSKIEARDTIKIESIYMCSRI